MTDKQTKKLSSMVRTLVQVNFHFVSSAKRENYNFEVAQIWEYVKPKRTTGHINMYLWTPQNSKTINVSQQATCHHLTLNPRISLPDFRVEYTQEIDERLP